MSKVSYLLAERSGRPTSTGGPRAAAASVRCVCAAQRNALRVLAEGGREHTHESRDDGGLADGLVANEDQLVLAQTLLRAGGRRHHVGEKLAALSRRAQMAGASAGGVKSATLSKKYIWWWSTKSSHYLGMFWCFGASLAKTENSPFAPAELWKSFHFLLLQLLRYPKLGLAVRAAKLVLATAVPRNAQVVAGAYGRARIACLRPPIPRRRPQSTQARRQIPRRRRWRPQHASAAVAISAISAAFAVAGARGEREPSTTRTPRRQSRRTLFTLAARPWWEGRW